MAKRYKDVQNMTTAEIERIRAIRGNDWLSLPPAQRAGLAKKLPRPKADYQQLALPYGNTGAESTHTVEESARCRL